jgi:hypothetical protein
MSLLKLPERNVVPLNEVLKTLMVRTHLVVLY